MIAELRGIFGMGGCGRGVMPLASSQLSASGGEFELVFVDDHPRSSTCNGHDVLTFEEFLDRPAINKRIAIAVADGSGRRIVANRCRDAGIGYFDVVADTHVRMDDVQIGEGCLISPYTVFTSNIQIGRHFHANLYSYVEHDCVVGDFVTFAPGVKCNGNIIIEDDVYVGAGAVIRQGTHDKPLRIGKGAVIGMGAVVTKDVAPGVTVAGNPARPLVR